MREKEGDGEMCRLKRNNRGNDSSYEMEITDLTGNPCSSLSRSIF